MVPTNGFIANSSKIYLLTSSYEKRHMKIHDSFRILSFSEVLLGVLIDSKLTFHDHITWLCNRVNQKFSALTRVSKYMALPKQHLLMNSCITSQFNYYPFVWMIYIRKLNKKTKKFQKRVFRTVYCEHKTSFWNFWI